ncbi:hypothetical protein FOA52_006423 [Chlamydomonas sp. UWO 241]|nr:hypothetical protein FOA52_006423 [Chlamydomonas sp. UWO 241]
MPPKAKVDEGLQVDTSPHGAFITVAIDAAEIYLAPAAEGGAVPEGCKTHLVLSYPGGFIPLKGEPTEVGVPYCFQQALRVQASPGGLHLLINGAVTLSVHESSTDARLASAELDMLPFALGSTGWTLSGVVLVPADDVGASPVKVASGALPSVRVSLAARCGLDPQLSGEGPAAPQPTADQLPAPEPWAFLEGAAADGANVLELSISNVSPVPPGLAAAAAAAKEGKAPGSLTVSFALSVPGVLNVPPLVVSGCTLSGDGSGAALAPGRRARVCLTPEQSTALLEHLEDGGALVLDAARYLAHDGLIDGLWAAYTGRATLSSADSLAVAGVAAVTEVVPLGSLPGAGGAPLVLPTYAPSNAKGKQLDEPSTDASACAWAVARTSVGVCVRLAAPLVAPWAPPPSAQAPLEALVTRRPDLAKVAPKADALGRFTALAASMARALQGLALQGSSDGSDVPDAHALAAQLTASGRYREMADALSQAAADVALERYAKSATAGIGGAPDGPSDDAIRALHEELHAVLAAAAAAVTPSECTDAPAEASTDRSLTLASECEAAGLTRRAEALHQRRVLSAGPVGAAAADAWAEYGAFCMRTGLHGRGEECLRRGLAAQPDHPACTLALGAALLHAARAIDVLHLNEAAALLSSPAAAGGQGQQVLSAMAAVTAAAAPGTPPAAAPAAAAALGAFGTDANAAFLATARILLRLGLPYLALAALQHAADAPAAAVPATDAPEGAPAAVPAAAVLAAVPAAGAPEGAAAAVTVADGSGLGEDLALARADALRAVGGQAEMEQAVTLLTLVASGGGPRVGAAWEALGHVHHARAAWRDAVSAYSESLKSAGSEGGFCPSALATLQLAGAYEAMGHPRYALPVYTRATRDCPSARAWLGVASCRAALGEGPAAGTALSEAAALDPESPSVWGLLTLLALRGGRTAEAAPALKAAVTLGLEDGALLADLGKEYARLPGGDDGSGSGRSGARVAENLLRAAATVRPADAKVQALLESLVAGRTAAATS